MERPGDSHTLRPSSAPASPRSAASMGAWVLDYVSGWAGEWGMVTHSEAQYRNPAFTGDATFLSGVVAETWVDRRGRHLERVDEDLRTQDDAVLARAKVEVALPDEAALAAGRVNDGQERGSIR